MSGKGMSDFERGYDYARRRYAEMATANTRDDLLELAVELSQDKGENAELARGMAEYYLEAVRQRSSE